MTTSGNSRRAIGDMGGGVKDVAGGAGFEFPLGGQSGCWQLARLQDRLVLFRNGRIARRCSLAGSSSTRKGSKRLQTSIASILALRSCTLKVTGSWNWSRKGAGPIYCCTPCRRAEKKVRRSSNLCSDGYCFANAKDLAGNSVSVSSRAFTAR
jgi:hypothetical protein